MTMTIVIGETLGALTVLGHASKDAKSNRQVLVACVCGTEKVVRESRLLRGETKSCGRPDCRPGVGTHEDRFWRRVDKDGPVVRPELGPCWIWTGQLRQGGYGVFGFRGGSKAHRFAWSLANGPVPDGMFVCHRCDNPPCCNSAHLFVGTAADNNLDKLLKGRVPIGESSSNAKLRREHVLEIRDRYARGELPGQLAKTFGVSASQVGEIVSRRQWRHC